MTPYKQLLLGLAAIAFLSGAPSLPAFADEPPVAEEAAEALASDLKVPKVRPAAVRTKTAVRTPAKRAQPRETAVRVSPVVERAPTYQRVVSRQLVIGLNGL
jgi:hypothetical protein